MKHRVIFNQLVWVFFTVVLGSLAMAQTAFAQASSRGQSKGTIVEMDRLSFQQQLKALGYKTRGGIARAKTESADKNFVSLTHFSSSFTLGGVTYPYTMLGNPPQSGHADRVQFGDRPLADDLLLLRSYPYRL